jgi:hypothetical protein
LSKEGELAAIEQIRQERDVLAEMVRTLQEQGGDEAGSQAGD